MALLACITLPFTPNPRRHDGEPVAEPATPPDPPAAVDSTPQAELTPKPAGPAKPGPAPAGDSPPAKHVPVAELAAERDKRKAAVADAAKAQADLAAANLKLQEFEDAKKSDLERAQAQATRALEQVAQANRRAVASDIRSAAITAEALDPTDVLDVLERRADEFIKDGVIDGAAIDAAVAEVLEKKKHWRRPPPASPEPVVERKPAPKPDPSQGPRGASGPPDFSDPNVLAAEKRRLGLPAYGR